MPTVYSYDGCYNYNSANFNSLKNFDECLEEAQNKKSDKFFIKEKGDGSVMCNTDNIQLTGKSDKCNNINGKIIGSNDPFVTAVYKTTGNSTNYTTIIIVIVVLVLFFLFVLSYMWIKRVGIFENHDKFSYMRGRG